MRYYISAITLLFLSAVITVIYYCSRHTEYQKAADIFPAKPRHSDDVHKVPISAVICPTPDDINSTLNEYAKKDLNLAKNKAVDILADKDISYRGRNYAIQHIAKIGYDGGQLSSYWTLSNYFAQDELRSISLFAMAIVYEKLKSITTAAMFEPIEMDFNSKLKSALNSPDCELLQSAIRSACRAKILNLSTDMQRIAENRENTRFLRSEALDYLSDYAEFDHRLADDIYKKDVLSRSETDILVKSFEKYLAKE